MLPAAILLGLAGGLLLGGRLDNLLHVRLRWAAAIFLAVVVRFGTELAIRNGIEAADTLRLPLYALAFTTLFSGLWANREQPGLLVAAAGVLCNGVAVSVNGGWMPVWPPALEFAGLAPSDLVPSFHRLLPEELGLPFLLQGGPLADLLPIPFAPIRNVTSVGDVLLATGLGWFALSTLVQRPPLGERVRIAEAVSHRLAAALAGAVPHRLATALSGAGGGGPAAGGIDRPGTVGPSRSAIGAESTDVAAHAYPDAAAIDRPVILGGTPSASAPQVAVGVGSADQELPALAPLAVRLARHPFGRLALDPRFSAFWFGQTVSLFGDRLHQVALAVLVYGGTGSPLLTGLVFLAATLPNVLLGPIAGTFVDRWDHKQVLVVSDLLRAVLVLVLPVAAAQNIALVYPLVFVITTVSLFFRPAKAAVLPRIVTPRDLMAANSATWTSETFADLLGYPLAGVFVALLGPSLALAFWADAATYAISAVVILGLTIPPVVRSAARAGAGLGNLLHELREGWAFLRGQPALFQNTLISAMAQTSIGATLALMVVYARDALDGTLIGYPGSYAALETAIGLGNLAGGLAVGAVGAQLRKGYLIAAGFLVMGLATLLLGLTGNVALALVAALVIGVANLVYVIPTQTLFAELTPAMMMGRVVAFRSSLVFGAMTAAMGVSGVLAEAIPVGLVICGFGAVTALCGVVAAALPAIRDS